MENEIKTSIAKHTVCSTFLAEENDWGWKYAFTTNMEISKEQHKQIIEAINSILAKTIKK
ncbi:MAG: hypothetical protein ABI091_30185 [Ferruginibacter sp.]